MSEEGESMGPNWEAECMVCGQKPTVSDTGLCGPCCFGSADALDWWMEGGMGDE